jgi:hypothetical protein
MEFQERKLLKLSGIIVLLGLNLSAFHNLKFSCFLEKVESVEIWPKL